VVRRRQQTHSPNRKVPYCFGVNWCFCGSEHDAWGGVCYRGPVLQVSLVLRPIAYQARFCFEARLDPLNRSMQEISRDARLAERLLMVYITQRSMLVALGIVQDHVSGMRHAYNSACPRNVSSKIRPVYLLAHPISGRYIIARFVDQGRKGDTSKFWRACGFWDIVASVFTPVAAEAPATHTGRCMSVQG
jgi:hypothetical protein